MSIEYKNAPLDETSTRQLAADGLRFVLVDPNDSVVFTEWSQSVSRGFLQPRDSAELIAQRVEYFDRRASAVYDDTAADAASPIATIDVWPADLTVPGHRAVPAWAISAVTVAPTHRRRGVATALLEAELRTASALGIPVAMLTVSEATIYGHFGFAPSAHAVDLVIDTRRAKLTGPRAEGRVHFVTREQLVVDGLAIVQSVRLETPGQIEYSGVLWERQLGMMVDDDSSKSLRFVRYDSLDGTPEGFAVYKLKESDADFAEHELVLLHLVTATDAAYRGLWQYLLEMDLTTKISAHLRPVGEPLRWMVGDIRSIKQSEFDHLWTRILDVKAALEARTYASRGRVVFEVTDPHGFAAGTWALEVDEAGSATVAPSTEPVEATLSVNELSALYLGGVPAATLQHADRISGDAAKLDTFFRSPKTPWLSIWF